MKSRKASRSINRKSTSKNRRWTSFKREIVIKFLELLNTVKLYHWKTHSYSTHKATDELYSKLNENIDTFIEVLLGKSGDRVDLSGQKTISLRSFSTSNELKRYLVSIKEYLVKLDKCDALIHHGMSNSDLFNIRDEILANINQFLYLLSFM